MRGRLKLKISCEQISNLKKAKNELDIINRDEIWWIRFRETATDIWYEAQFSLVNETICDLSFGNVFHDSMNCNCNISECILKTDIGYSHKWLDVKNKPSCIKKELIYSNNAKDEEYRSIEKLEFSTKIICDWLSSL